MMTKLSGYYRGHPIHNKTDNQGEWQGWKFKSDDTLIDREAPIACTKCHKVVSMGEPDPCLGMLPGVKNACCGHGIEKDAYIQFENGVTVRGTLDVDQHQSNKVVDTNHK